MSTRSPEDPSRPHNREGAALGYALAAVAAWSTVATGFKLGLQVLEPVQLLLLGSAVSALLFAVLATAGGHWRLPPRGRPASTTPVPSHRLVQVAAFGLLNPVLYYLVLFEAYDRLPAQIAQPLNYTWAITMALLAVPVLGQRLNRNTLTGIAVSYLGVVVLLTRGSLHGWSELDWLGVVLALGSTVLWAGYWLANARSAMPPLTLMAWSFLLATPVLAAACYLGPGWPPITLETLGYGAWVGLLEMGFTFLLWQRALRLTARAARIGQLIFLSPFLSLVFIATVLGEVIHATSAIGLAIIVAGLWVSRREPSQG